MSRRRESDGPWTAILQVFGVMLLAVLGRRLGLDENAAAAALATGATAVLVAHAARRVRRGGGSRILVVTFASAIAIPSLVPPLRSMFPGRPILSARLERDGSSVALPPGSAGPVTLLVSSELPEDQHAYIGFTLALGPERVEGALEHGVRRWGAGENVRQYHVSRSSMYLDSRIAPGMDRLSLERLASAVPSTLRVDVYRRVIPTWMLVVGGLLALLFAGVVDAVQMARSHVSAIAGAALGGGLLAGWSATPEQALWPTIVSLAFGAFVGVPAGFATSAAARWLRRRLKP